MKPLHIIHHTLNALKRLALASGFSALVALSAGSAQALSTIINLGAQGSGTAIGGQEKVLKIAQGVLPAGSFLRSVAINARVDVGDPYCGDICVFVADSSGANGVLLVGDYDTDSASAPAATTSVLWNAGKAYGVGTTVNTTITTGIPAMDLNGSAVFLTSAYGGTWSGSITLTYDGPAVAGIAQRGSATSASITSGTSLTIAKPTDVVAGDVMIVNIAQAVASSSAATSSGWTLIKNGALGGTNTSRYGTLLYKVAGASEGTGYTFTLTPGVNGAVGAIVAYSGVNPASPLDAVGASFRPQ